MSMIVWPLVVAVLILFGAALATWGIRKYRKAGIAAADEIAVLREHIDAGQEQLAAQLVENTAALSAASEQHSAELERLRGWAASGLRWEARSRQHILRLLNLLGHDGFVATNVCFTARNSQGAFIHQVDHMVVTRRTALVVEAKSWDGLVFHFEKGARAVTQEEIERFGPLRSLAAGTHYALHVRADHAPNLHAKGNEVEPAKQVRRQAKALSILLRESKVSEKVPFFDTCVYYSHPGSVLVGGSRFLSDTAVVDEAGLEALLRDAKRAHDDSVIRALGGWAATYGADVVGVGRFADTWESEFPRL